MVRLLFTFMLIIHGLIHLLGFVKEWKLAPVTQLSGKTLLPLSGAAARVSGGFWLLACLLFAAAALGFLLRKDWWWMAAAAGVVVSQVLIVLYWPDAKAGTIANVIAVLVMAPAYGDWRIDRMVSEEVTSLFSGRRGEPPEPVTEDMLSGLPPVVQRWLRRAGVVGRERPRFVRLKQEGAMRTKPGGKWMPAEAEQYFRVDEPAFIWKARIRAAPLLYLTGRDKYAAGHGNMLIKLLSLVPVADAAGPEMDQGTLLRFLGESIWFPGAALSDYLTWEAAGEQAARVTMRYGGVEASGLLSFDTNGDPVRFEAQRYGEFNGTYSRETWVVDMSDIREMAGGIRVPTHAEVTWKLNDGDFTWYRLDNTALEYNVAEMY